MMKFRIPVTWECYGCVEIEANSLEEAIKIAKEDDSISLPEGNYVDSSWEVNEDMALIRCLNKGYVKETT